MKFGYSIFYVVFAEGMKDIHREIDPAGQILNETGLLHFDWREMRIIATLCNTSKLLIAEGLIRDYGEYIIKELVEDISSELEGTLPLLQRANVLAEEKRLGHACEYNQIYCERVEWPDVMGKPNSFEFFILDIYKRKLGGPLFNRLKTLEGIPQEIIGEKYRGLAEVLEHVFTPPEELPRMKGPDFKTALERAVQVWEKGDIVSQIPYPGDC